MLSELQAPEPWSRVDFISDLHLHTSDPGTHRAWVDYLQHTSAQALFILGDLFEVWVGDDCLDDPDSFEALCAKTLLQASARLPVYVMQGNRDFLLGPRFAHRCGVTLIADPFTFHFSGEHLVLSHGDALCVDDVEYQAFRAQVRTPDWHREFLAKPLAQRLTIAAELRRQSEARKSQHLPWIDVDTAAALQALDDAQASTLIHGHTHQPGTHTMAVGKTRHVLSDWCVGTAPARAEVLRLRAALPTSDRRQLEYLRLAPQACHEGLPR